MASLLLFDVWHPVIQKPTPGDVLVSGYEETSSMLPLLQGQCTIWIYVLGKNSNQTQYHSVKVQVETSNVINGCPRSADGNNDSAEKERWTQSDEV